VFCLGSVLCRWHLFRPSPRFAGLSTASQQETPRSDLRRRLDWVPGVAGERGILAGAGLEICAAWAYGNVGVVERVGVEAGRVGGEDSVEEDLRAVVVIVAVEKEVAPAGDADVVQRDIAEGGRGVSFDRSVGRVGGGHVDWAGGVADADVVVDYVVYEASSCAGGLDADAGVCAVEREVGDADCRWSLNRWTFRVPSRSGYG
jgi:hypothetical protein